MPLPLEVYAERRRVVLDRIGARGAAVFPAAPVAMRAADVEHRYRPDADLLYLTGFPEPEAVCLLLPGHPTDEFVLFVRPRNPERETWTGPRTGVEGAVEQYGAQSAHPIDTLDQKIVEYVGERDALYCAVGRDRAFAERVLGWLRHWQQCRPRTGKGPTALLDPAPIVHEQRLIKRDEEIDRMRRAAGISAEAHLLAMRSARHGEPEYAVEALIDHTFRRLGGNGPAYPSIVASGINATVLHYTANERTMRDGDLLLVDAGAEFDGYCADITRTYPVGRDFTPAQRAIYEVVLRAQAEAISVVRAEARIDDVHRRAVEVIVDGLLDLRVLLGERAEILEKDLYKPFYMHRTSHWLGLDVHDAGAYKEDDGGGRRLVPGMVLTVEPGIYIGPGCVDVDPRFAGIGVRIEDDVLVTATGCDVLTAAVPKDPADLAAVRRSVGP
ncbi:aminopeptidase P N-terminal domain-containing protein [Candidatus Binatia bacterium]|nr:aminopeptidase P N-terminal domain-containing protein [Candidatus Binatia bacterium]